MTERQASESAGPYFGHIDPRELAAGGFHPAADPAEPYPPAPAGPRQRRPSAGDGASPRSTHAVYLIRYLAGEATCLWLDKVFLAKWVVAALAALALLAPRQGSGARALGVVLAVAFGLAWLAQTGLRRLVRRVAVPPHARERFDPPPRARTRWRPRRAGGEVAGAGLPNGPLALLTLARRLAHRRPVAAAQLDAVRALLANRPPGAWPRR